MVASLGNGICPGKDCWYIWEAIGEVETDILLLFYSYDCAFVCLHLGRCKAESMEGAIPPNASPFRNLNEKLLNIQESPFVLGGFFLIPSSKSSYIHRRLVDDLSLLASAAYKSAPFLKKKSLSDVRFKSSVFPWAPEVSTAFLCLCYSAPSPGGA